MIAHLPILQVALPLLAAPLCVLLRSARAAWWIYLLASVAAFGSALLLASSVATHGPLHYAVGNWAPPFGIAYVIDAANAFVLVLVSGIAVATAIYAPRSIAAEIDPQRVYLYYACLCLCLTGLLGIVATGDAFNVFVFLEISSLSSYALIALGKRRQALLAAFRYLVMGTLGGTFVLIGIGLAYAVTGTLNMADLAQRLPALYGNRTLTAAVGFVSVGLAIKAAVFPLHAWLPSAYAEAPSAAGVFLSATGTKVAIYAFLRFAFGIFGAGLVFGHLPMSALILIVGTAAMLAGAAIACYQDDLKRILAWSSVGQIGYIVVGLGLASQQGLSAAFLHISAHALIKGGLFATAGIVALRLGTTRIDALAGLARSAPAVFVALLLGGLGLIGVPLTAGFVSKWALVMALIEADQWAVIAAVLLSSLLALVYVGRIIEVAWFREPPLLADTAQPSTPAPMALAMWGLVGVSLVAGVYAAPLSRAATAAAAALLGTAP
ncbi:MAG: proton-conducting transporter membrane subunit [Nevskiales bacterium]|nr:proton-conducting transporter membrane subunit [Nevskiales bacterium]